MTGVVSGGVLPEVRLANDITRQFAHLDHDVAVGRIAAHISEFWEPRMRARFAQHVATGGEGLDPMAIEAAARLRP